MSMHLVETLIEPCELPLLRFRPAVVIEINELRLSDRKAQLDLRRQATTRSAESTWSRFALAYVGRTGGSRCPPLGSSRLSLKLSFSVAALRRYRHRMGPRTPRIETTAGRAPARPLDTDTRRRRRSRFRPARHSRPSPRRSGYSVGRARPREARASRPQRVGRCLGAPDEHVSHHRSSSRSSGSECGEYHGSLSSWLRAGVGPSRGSLPSALRSVSRSVWT